MSALVLLSSMGFFVDHMVCLMSGEHNLAINTQVEHCSDSCDMEAETVAKTCCDYDSFYFKDDTPASASEQKNEWNRSAFAYLSVSSFLAKLNPETTIPDLHWDQPQPLPGVKRFILLETYLL